MSLKYEPMAINMGAHLPLLAPLYWQGAGGGGLEAGSKPHWVRERERVCLCVCVCVCVPQWGMGMEAGSIPH